MSESAVILTEASKTLHDDIQKKKKNRWVLPPATQSHPLRYGVFHISGGNIGGMIDVEKIGPRDNNYEEFIEDLLQKDGEKDDCRYGSKLPPPNLEFS